MVFMASVGIEDMNPVMTKQAIVLTLLRALVAYRRLVLCHQTSEALVL